MDTIGGKFNECLAFRIYPDGRWIHDLAGFPDRRYATIFDQKGRVVRRLRTCAVDDPDVVYLRYFCDLLVLLPLFHGTAPGCPEPVLLLSDF